MGSPAMAVEALVELLLQRRTREDVQAAESAIARLGG